jgi:putative toxin-antitoxin system antitoxin component (TIGR02293 family)
MTSSLTKAQPKSERTSAAKRSVRRRSVFAGKARTVEPDALAKARASAGKGKRRLVEPSVFAYSLRKGGVLAYVRSVQQASPMELVRLELQGVQGAFIKDLSKSMDLPASRVFSILGVPKATAEKKAAAGEFLRGSGGQSAIGMIRLLGIAQDLVDSSTAIEAQDFDAAKWLGRWIETPQPALGGLKPADVIDTPTGVAMVARVLGSHQSGAYQ